MKKAIIIILLLLTLVLGAGAIYLGYKLQQEPSTAPKESEAAACPAGCGSCDDGSCNQCCLGGSRAGTCTSDADWTSGWFACNQQPGEGGGCTITTISGSKDSFTFSSGCTNATIKRYQRSYDGTSYAFYPNCITDDTNGTFIGEEHAGAGATYTVSYAPGICEQIDAFNNGGFLVGVCRCNPRAPICNESCDSSRTCSSGFSCINGVCRNPECPDEVNCSCPSEPSCGNGVIESGEACDPNADPTGCSTNQTCSTSCICEDIHLSCGNGVIDSGEACDPNADPTGCATGETCNNACVCVIPNLPSTAIIDTTDKKNQLLFATLAILSGLILLRFNIKCELKKIYSKIMLLAKNIIFNSPFVYTLAPFSSEARNVITNRKKEKLEENIIKNKD